MNLWEGGRTMKNVLNVKELRSSLPEIIKRVRQGDRFTILYRSKPAFRIVPVEAEEEITFPLSDDSLYQAPPVGRSSDGLAARDHDITLYGRGGH
jgi:prevent-host-death family protein